ncbi:Hypothetical protein FKW44_009340 [Caligus rogercresseyi]|uniref:Uncharacterized protein n=1 Tax=Caligus rogercresseyi TaxID=217165 RepID=A0A7T8K7E8_CALRO|nr:Hypothetical protein FKW44_019487 [Caligus rogercresseyi]QQP48879.1 Hypothetical protein FKW44_009340 [Caligus rogercresseyi]
MNYLRFRLQNSPFINYAKDTGDDLPSSHPPTSFKLIAAAPRNPRVYFQDKNKTSNNTILSTATNHNDTHNSFMIRAVICPPIRRRPLFRGGGGGSTCPTSTHTETEHHFNSSRRACHEDTTQATLHGPGERLPSPTHSRRRTKHHHALACIGLTLQSL